MEEHLEAIAVLSFETWCFVVSVLFGSIAVVSERGIGCQSQWQSARLPPKFPLFLSPAPVQIALLLDVT